MGKKLEVEQSVMELALQRVRRTYELCDRVSVAFSGGKDSTVTLHVALQVARELGKLPLDVVFFDEEAIPPDTVEYCKRVAALDGIAFRWLCVPIKHRNACSKQEPYWHPWDPDKRELWVRPMPDDLPPNARLITSLPGVDFRITPETHAGLHPPEWGTTGFMFGIRTQESLRRFRGVTHRTHDNFISTDPLAKHVMMSKPIYDWHHSDVWAFPNIAGTDYNHAYDKMAAVGMTAHQQRVSPPYGEEPIERLWTYAACWPELWERMIARVPGAATAARYSRSPLYGYGGGSIGEWNVEEDPRELIKRAVDRWEPKTAKQVAERIRVEIKRHYGQTKLPIPLEEIGPTGISWRWLYMIAYRGDLKGRRNPKIKSGETRPAE